MDRPKLEEFRNNNVTLTNQLAETKRRFEGIESEQVRAVAAERDALNSRLSAIQIDQGVTAVASKKGLRAKQAASHSPQCPLIQITLHSGLIGASCCKHVPCRRPRRGKQRCNKTPRLLGIEDDSLARCDGVESGFVRFGHHKIAYRLSSQGRGMGDYCFVFGRHAGHQSLPLLIASLLCL